MEYLIPQNSEIRIRKASKKQIFEIKKLLENNFLRLDQKNYKNDKWFVAIEGEKIVGGYRLVFHDKKHTELASLFVLAENRCNGVGSTLVNHAIQKSPTKIYALSGKRVEFYEKKGFCILRRCPSIFKKKLARMQKNLGAEFEARVLVAEKKKNIDTSFTSKPDLVVLDGGKGQLSAVLKNVKFPKGVEVVGLAKREEEIFRVTNGKFERVLLPTNSPALFLVQRIRDEAHRFANSLREKLQDPVLLAKKGKIRL